MTQPAIPAPVQPPPLPGEPMPPAAAPSVPAARPSRGVLRLLVVGAICLILAVVALLIGGWNYALVQHFSFLRTSCLVSMILSGLSATLLFGGTMNCLDRLLDLSPPPPWYARLSIDLLKRVLLVLQLATTAATLTALGVLVFHRAIPVL